MQMCLCSSTELQQKHPLKGYERNVPFQVAPMFSYQLIPTCVDRSLYSHPLPCRQVLSISIKPQKRFIYHPLYLRTHLSKDAYLFIFIYTTNGQSAKRTSRAKLN